MGIDPWVSHLGGEIVSHNTTEARQVDYELACRRSTAELVTTGVTSSVVWFILSIYHGSRCGLFYLTHFGIIFRYNYYKPLYFTICIYTCSYSHLSGLQSSAIISYLVFRAQVSKQLGLHHSVSRRWPLLSSTTSYQRPCIQILPYSHCKSNECWVSQTVTRVEVHFVKLPEINLEN